MSPKVLVLLFTLITLGGRGQEKQDIAKKDLDQMQGTWTMEALEVNGKLVPQDKLGALLVIKANKYIVTVKKKAQETTITLDPGKKPKAIDMVFGEGANKDKVHKGIYSIDGDTLKICRGLNPDQERPTEFGTWPDTNYFLVTWKRK
jgi:uncharacterized protein (TIGR03067 family)